VSLTILKQLSPDRVAEVKTYILSLSQHFYDDGSNYTSGRKILWINKRYHLLEKTVQPAYQDERLWAFVQRLYPGADLALIGAGDSKIKPHRDAAYADFHARTLTLGDCTWQYQDCYEGMTWKKQQNPNAPIQTLEVKSGSLLQFNCKNPHACIDAEPGRISLSMWRLKQKD
jgi:hypothetical protein